MTTFQIQPNRTIIREIITLIEKNNIFIREFHKKLIVDTNFRQRVYGTGNSILTLYEHHLIGSELGKQADPKPILLISDLSKSKIEEVYILRALAVFFLSLISKVKKILKNNTNENTIHLFSIDNQNLLLSLEPINENGLVMTLPRIVSSKKLFTKWEEYCDTYTDIETIFVKWVENFHNILPEIVSKIELDSDKIK